MQHQLSQDRLKQLLNYDPETGRFSWKVSARTKRPDRPFGAGCLSPAGYVVLRVDQKLYPAHRLAWLYMNGSWPSKDLDHIDGRRVNNAIANLREAEQVENQQNRRGAKR
ncbi:MAG: HNH endonuclease signature motif containing protein, partial [Gammaproteobacteria bacterium]